jgi:hypothetical protein
MQKEQLEVENQVGVGIMNFMMKHLKINVSQQSQANGNCSNS